MSVFFRQGLCGGTCATAIPEFCQFANQPGRSVIRLQIDVSPALSLSSHQWYLIIHYCLFCFNLSNSAAIVLFPPDGLSELNLFMISPVHYSWEFVKAEDQKVIYQMICLQIAMWYVKSKTGYNSMIVNEENVLPFNAESPATFMTWAIFKLLTVRRVETIHQLAEHLQLNYQIESDYLHNDYSFNRLRFRQNHSAWIPVEELLLHASDLKIWLNFNRLTRGNSIASRILAGIANMG
ncbi:hypothetical protein IC229_00905 [Spirosoma sp. BT702]|uniref:Uncharacterized protein n=1 Tax=Spirosoma profusum TaxID=2771354 RepID=A0A926XTF3_9BACT|nr:hypothetical protein [Spirosoma profusum]MBD2699175.1 hypothetical protein [Spirosoma profusum]